MSTTPTTSVPEVAIAAVTAPDPYRPRVPDVPAAFNAVSKDGVRHTYKGEPWVPNMVESHVQGVAPCREYLFLTHNNKGYSRGYIIIINRDRKKMVQKFDTPDEHFNHPGGCQTIGSYVAVAVENSGYSESYIHFYDLSGMTDTTQPALLTYNLHSTKSGCGGVGITNYTEAAGAERYLLAAYDNGKLDVYQSNPVPLSDPNLQFTQVGVTIKLPESGYSEVCLVTQADQSIYLAGFRTDDLGLKNEDWADLYSITVSSTVSAKRLKSRHMYSKHGGVVGAAGVHFRYGAGLQVRSDLSLEFFATQRNFAGGEISTNTFRKK